MTANPRTYNLCIVGFGNVGKALVKLLQRKSTELRERHGIEWKITGVASRSLGWIASAEGLNPDHLLDNHARSRLKPTAQGIRDWLTIAKAQVLFEASSLNRHNGQPAIEYLQAALHSGAHAISANKGPVVFALSELSELARAKGKRFLFESAVMDGVPIFSLFRETLPAVHVSGFRGILNATTNVVLESMEAGLQLSAAVRKAQEMGIAESDPSDDLEGWDAAVKVAALSAVVLGCPLQLHEIERQGITTLDTASVQAARQSGMPYKLVCQAHRDGDRVWASVNPEQLPLSDPLSRIDGGSSCIHLELDILPGLTIIEHDGNVETTAYGMFADFIRAVRDE
ncbi:MAG TPA: homoserine dehydrogenase [Candidatus Angelobacter sp.]|nr:homoserine dehydrogenase [Candidatus Angelobacter sp.]